ncbi:hypothetical protein [Bradyrhizobium sp. 2TAF24]|uniref:hypothetical protein n=1 Tax=Bradyrhizobium sp. 2TAF24 TaxID=3233011 RepID=UPI003F935FB9
MSMPRALAMYVDLLRDEVASAGVKRVRVRRARMATELQELLSLVDVTAEMTRIGDTIHAACGALCDALERQGLPGPVKVDLVREGRQRALAAIDALEQHLRLALPSDEARALGVAWCGDGREPASGRT